MVAFRGSTDECFKHFFEASRKSRAERLALAESVGVSVDSTLRRWFTNRSVPTGGHRTRLQSFLVGRGYGVTDVGKPDSSSAKHVVSAKRGLNGGGDKTFMINAAAHIISGLIPIADFLLSDSCSAADRKKLHERAGADSVLMLTSRLRRLCSETARKQL